MIRKQYNQNESLMDSNSVLDQDDEEVTQNEEEQKEQSRLHILPSELENTNPNEETFVMEQANQFAYQIPNQKIFEFIIRNQRLKKQYRDLAISLSIREAEKDNEQLNVVYSLSESENNIIQKLDSFFNSFGCYKIKTQNWNQNTIRSMAAKWFENQLLEYQIHVNYQKLERGVFTVDLVFQRDNVYRNEIAKYIDTNYSGIRLFLNNNSDIFKGSNLQYDTKIGELRGQYFNKFMKSQINELLQPILLFTEIYMQKQPFVSLILGFNMENQKREGRQYLLQQIREYIQIKLNYSFYLRIQYNNKYLQEIYKLQQIFNDVKVKNEFKATSILFKDTQQLFVICDCGSLVELIEQHVQPEIDKIKSNFSIEFIQHLIVAVNSKNYLQVFPGKMYINEQCFIGISD